MIDSYWKIPLFIRSGCNQTYILLSVAVFLLIRHWISSSIQGPLHSFWNSIFHSVTFFFTADAVGIYSPTIESDPSSISIPAPVSVIGRKQIGRSNCFHRVSINPVWRLVHVVPNCCWSSSIFTLAWVKIFWWRRCDSASDNRPTKGESSSRAWNLWRTLAHQRECQKSVSYSAHRSCVRVWPPCLYAAQLDWFNLFPLGVDIAELAWLKAIRHWLPDDTLPQTWPSHLSRRALICLYFNRGPTLMSVWESSRWIMVNNSFFTGTTTGVPKLGGFLKIYFYQSAGW